MTLLAALIVLLVFGPVLILVPSLLILCAAGLLSNDGPRVVRKAFRCPVKRRMVTVDFVVPAAGAARPSSLVSCSAFSDPKRVTCAKRCVDFAEVHWTPPIGAFARWSLAAGGVVTPNGSHGPAPAPAVPAVA